MSHDQDVTRQFDDVAERYEKSAVHAEGPDLALFRAAAERLRPHRALDVGCGPGHVALALAPFCAHVHAVDASSAMLAIAAARARKAGHAHVGLQEASATRLPFADAAMDLVTCRFSAHHWRDVTAGIREIGRVLRTGATFILTDSVGFEDPLTDTHLQAIEVLRDPTHVRNYTVSAWMALLAAQDLMPLRTDHFRIRLAFADWVTRAKTSPARVDAITDLLREAPAEARARLGVEADGSFHLDVVTVQCEKRGY
ncbi:class I SAM-dependent methyltransferase [Acidiferrobacter sp.]|jgi:ubiquinone/menaquinone biosynthesis C-methylase UbiE|uniref:class I SAM-dependent methyltransferase n=1 Tax=Acidiferrobacter sp. TaxID=1872107 RepID=UPI0026138860|nr:class I SAM-dependent methyltransferase [Acidiferrobacter sp.]